MKKNRRIILLLMVIMSSIWFIIYNLKSFNIYGTNFPCVGFTTYTIGEFYEKNSKKVDANFSEYNEYSIWDITEMKSGNINSIEGLTEIPYFNDINALQLSGTCIKEVKFLQEPENLSSLSVSNTKINSFEDLGRIENIRELHLGGTNINKLEGIQNMNNLTVLDLLDAKITTIENVEKIRTDSTRELVIRIGTIDNGESVKNITRESYDYAVNPENNIRIRVYNKNCKVIITGQDFGDSKEKVEECLNII